MPRTVRGCLKAWSVQEGTAESKNNASVPHLEKQADSKEDQVIADYELDVNSKPKGSDSNDKLDAQEEGEENSKAKYAKMECPCQGTLRQRTMHC